MKLRNWAIPLASVAPVVCIAAAFSLGPSVEKQLLVYQNASSAQERAVLFEAGGPALWRHLEARRTRLPQAANVQTAKLLWHNNPERMDASILIADEKLPVAFRAEVLEALAGSHRRDAIELSERYNHLDSPLGQVARRTLERQARSELSP